MSEVFKVGDIVRVKTLYSGVVSKDMVNNNLIIERLSDCSGPLMNDCPVTCNRRFLYLNTGSGWCPYRFEKIKGRQKARSSNSNLRRPNSKEFNKIIGR